MFRNYTFRGQQMRRWVPFTVIGLLGVLVILSIIVMVRHKPVPREYYAEKPIQQANGTVVIQQPDHGWAYYWLMAQANRPVRPTYHVYVPPPPRTYVQPIASSTPPSSTPATSPRDTGGFSRPPTRTPTASQILRSTGGFSKPTSTSTSPRNTGGFSSTKPTSSASPRNSGGFSKSATPSSSPRSSGGFSKPKPKGGGY